MNQPIVDVHRNNSDPDLGVELETQLSLPQATGFHDKREMSRSGSVDDLDSMNEGEKVRYSTALANPTTSIRSLQLRLLCIYSQLWYNVCIVATAMHKVGMPTPCISADPIVYIL